MRRKQSCWILDVDRIDVLAVVELCHLFGVEGIRVDRTEGIADAGNNLLKPDLLGHAGIGLRRLHIVHRIDNPHAGNAMAAQEFVGKTENARRRF